MGIMRLSMLHGLEDPIRLDEISTVFSDEAIARIATHAGLPLGTGSQQTAPKRLADVVRARLYNFAVEVRRPTPNTIHREIEALARAAEAKNYERLASLVADLSDAARRSLETRAETARQMSQVRIEAWKDLSALRGSLRIRCPVDRSVDMPAAADFLDPERRESAADNLFRLAVVGRGRDWPESDGEYPADVPGSEADGKHSHSVEPYHDPKRLRLHAPGASRREPRREAERNLLRGVLLTTYVATGRMPPLTARHGFPGPFLRFAAECFRLARVRASDTDHDLRGLAVQLHNDIAPLRRRATLTRLWRRALGPLRRRYYLIDEVRRRLELGEAGVLRVPGGADGGSLPKRPAIIEFADSGTLCFWCPPIGHRTVAIKPFARRRIMQLAESVDALNARR
jgi:hypothetical protein